MIDNTEITSQDLIPRDVKNFMKILTELNNLCDSCGDEIVCNYINENMEEDKKELFRKYMLVRDKLTNEEKAIVYAIFSRTRILQKL